MNRSNIKSLSFAFALILACVSCESPQVEIVEFDESYSLDKSFISVEIPAKSTYNPNNIVKLDGGNEFTLIANVQDGVSVMASTEVPVRIRLRRALSEDLTLVLKEDRELLSQYRGEQLGFLPFPEKSIETYKMVIPAGQVQVESSFSLSDVSAFTEKAGYLTALSLEVEGNKEVTPSTKSNALFLKVKISNLIAGQNASLSDYAPEGGFISGITGRGNYQVSRIPDLFDDYASNYYGQWWVQQGSDTFVDALFEKSLITGVTFYCVPGSKGKSLRNITIEVSEDGGENFVYQGTVHIPNVRRNVHIVFDKPNEINAIRFSHFDTYSNDPSDLYTDLSEIRIYR